MASVEVLQMRMWRLRRVMTIRGLAAVATVSPQTIQEAEAGRRVPRFENIRKLADALGVAPEQIAEFRAALGYADEVGLN